MRFLSLLLPVVAIITSSFVRRANGFPNNLIVTTVGCMTELDPSEVIMNNMVKTVEESDFKKMHLVVVDENDNHVESPFHYKKDNTEIIVAFVNPYTRDEFNDDLQFIMEISNEGDAAEFVDGGTIGCDGNRRVAARMHDDNGRATIKIHDPTKTIEIVAGWATGQNAVRLTPKLVLEPRKEEEEKAEVVVEKEEEPKGGRSEEEKTAEKAPDNEVHAIKEGKLLQVPDDAAASGAVKPNSGSASKKRTKGEKVTNDAERAEERKMGHMKQRELPEEDGEVAQKEKEKETTKEEDDAEKNTLKVKNKKEFVETARKLKKARAGNTADEPIPDDASELNDDVVIKTSQDETTLEPITHRNSILKKTDNVKSPSRQSQQQQQEAEKKRRKQLEQQMNENFPEHHLDMGSHLFACAFFAFSIGSILFILGRKREKGRRDL